MYVLHFSDPVKGTDHTWDESETRNHRELEDIFILMEVSEYTNISIEGPCYCDKIRAKRRKCKVCVHAPVS